jgi:Peptidase M15
MTRVSVPVASRCCLALLGAVAWATTTPAQAEGNAWFEKVFSAPAAAGSTEGTGSKERSTRTSRAPRQVARVQRPAQQQVSDEPKSASLSGGGITWQASASCVPGALRGVLADLVGNFGPVTVTSTCRGRAQNRTAGGAGQSYHLSGEAVDFRVSASTGAVYAFLSASGNVGGLKHYGGGLFHIDTGPRRSW